MAGALRIISEYFASQYNSLRIVVLVILMGLLTVACEETDKMDLTIPQRQQTTYITDQVLLGGKTLFLWDEEGGCKLQVTSGTKQKNSAEHWLKPKAPCYFIKSPGSQSVQVFRKAKAIRVVAVVGTPAETNSVKHCGQEVQGVIMSGGEKVIFSDRVISDDIYCADNGLENTQYSRF